MYNLICMGFDGEYKTERFQAESVQDCWNKANDLGSKWFFYPFYFVVSESGKTVIDTPQFLDQFKGKRVKTMAKTFEKLSQKDYTKGCDVDTFVYHLNFASE